jgi:hypothetical protein
MKRFHLRFIDRKAVDAFLREGMKRAAGLVMLFALGFSAFAATPNVQVKIQHFSATAPLDDQPVRLEAMSVAAPVAVQRGFTDENGQITFNSMPAGRYKLFLFHTPELEINIPDTSGTIQASSYVTTEGWIIATADDAGVIDLQTTQVLLLGNGLTKAGNTLQLTEDVALTGSLKLSGEDDELTVDGGELKLNGEAISSGGETVWTNSAGIVTPAGGQALTNRLEYVSGAADNATNAAVVVDTAASWTGGVLLQAKNNGENAMRVGHSGGIGIGKNIVSLWNPGPSDALSAIHDISAGEDGEIWLNIQATSDSQKTNHVRWFAYGSQDSEASSELQYRDGDGLSTVGSYIDSAGPEIYLNRRGTNIFYIFNTGAIRVAQQSAEPSAPSAGRFTLFGIDNGSGKMILKVRFPTGASQTIATEP